MSSEAVVTPACGFAASEPPVAVAPSMEVAAPSLVGNVLQQSAGLLSVDVRNVSGNRLGKFAVELTATVRQFKADLEELCEVDVRHQKLLHGHVDLEDDSRWSDTVTIDENQIELTLVLVDRDALQDDTIKQAVDDFCEGFEAKDRVERKYGLISQWNTSKVTDMKDLFRDKASFNEDLRTWNVSNVTNMSCMFFGAESFNSDLCEWNVRTVIDMSWLLSRADAFNGDLSAWSVGNVADMSYMFYEARSFNGDLRTWNVSNVTDMNGMFCGASSFNCDLSAWNVSRVTDMSYMFAFAGSFNSNLSEWNVANAVAMSDMFCDAGLFTRDLSAWNAFDNVARMDRETKKKMFSCSKGSIAATSKCLIL